MIKRATILKHLKYHGKYERSHFTKKKAELEEICKNLGIDLTQNIDTPKEHVKPAVKKVVVIQEPDDSSDDDTSDEEEPVPQTPTPSPIPKIAKKLKRKNQKVEKVKEKSDPDNKVKVNEILKDLNRVIKDLFGEFDQKDLDQDDVNYIQSEFNITLNDAQDMLDPLIVDFSDSQISKIEAKIDLQYKKLDRFLS